ncbi:MAG: AAA family ATPase [Cyanobacteria bacterium P01_F01_bin.150]
MGTLYREAYQLSFSTLMTISAEHLFAQNGLQLLGYTRIEPIYQSTKTVVYRAWANASVQSVIIKCLNHDYPSFGEMVQFRNQYTITKNLSIPGIVKPLGLKPVGNSYALIMEDVGGVALSDYIQHQTLDVARILAIALQLADILHDLHQQRVIHKDIKPANILIHPDSNRIWLIDFSIASLLPKETQALQSPTSLEGTLAYLAPEQTGRMNRAIDYRSDFYALGITLYELLTGQLPFTSDDPLEMLHCHMAQRPVAIEKINPNVPAMVAAIASKLMEKNAEDRYQSELGLKHDLEQCRNQLQVKGVIAEFDLGERDVSDRFLIPEKLYGRERAVQTLLDAFDRVLQGASELMLVAGFSGIGKTAVVNEVHKPIVRQRGYFIKGKFDQFNRNIPFSAFVQAFRDLMGQLLGESDEALAHWKAKILAVVGDNGQELIEVIPELEQVIGTQPASIELSEAAAQNHFNVLFQAFISVFTTPDHPLVIFLDDLQWADSASLNLVTVLMGEGETPYLLLIGAYRDNEMFSAHPLMLTLEELEKQTAAISAITLSPLSSTHMNQLIVETLGHPAELVQPLTELIYRKTKGNPFFTTQFLKGLYEDHLIFFNADQGAWDYDFVKVQDAVLTDDVVSFLMGRLQRLPQSSQNTLKLAACIGNQFDLTTLTIVCESSAESVATDLWVALREGLIIPMTETYKFYNDREKDEGPPETIAVGYRFLHDRVQQAAYNLILENQKQITHLDIGRLLLKNTPDLDGNLFEIVNHWNMAIDLVHDLKEKSQLARLNLRAGCKAKFSVAYKPALKYFNTGLSLLPENCWETQYEIVLDLHKEAAKTAFICGDYPQMEKCSEGVLRNAKTVLDKVEMYDIQVQAQMAQAKPAIAIQIAFIALTLLDLHLPEAPTLSDIENELAITEKMWRGQDISELIALPEMTHPEILAAIIILSSIFAPAFIAKPDILPFIACKQIQLSLQYGNCDHSAFGYANYSAILNTICQDLDASYQFGQLAINLVNKFNTKSVKARTFNQAAIFSMHGKVHLRDAPPILQEGFQSGIETGDLEFAGYAAYNWSQYSYFSGLNLIDLQKGAETYGLLLNQFNQQISLSCNQLVQQSALNLLGKSEHTCRLTGDIFDEEDALKQFTDNQVFSGIQYLFLHKIILCFLFSEFDDIQEYIDRSEQYLNASTGMIMVPGFYFYATLSRLQLYSTHGGVDQSRLLPQIDLGIAEMERWANQAPMNFQHKFELLMAEYNRVMGKRYVAADFYDRAIMGAQTNGYPQEEAIANELAAQCYLYWGKEKVAAGYMQDAYYCYSRWGAKAKTNDLEKRYFDLLRPILHSSVQSTDLMSTLQTIAAPIMPVSSSLCHSSSSTSLNQTFDFASILKASQALSGTIKLDELLRQLTHIILQNSGGDRCALILPNESGDWQVRAIATPEEKQLRIEALHNNPHLPVKLIRYVKNTQGIVVINALETDLPVVDDYLRQQQPQSVLCLPILNQGHLIGILYLRNQLARDVFTQERILVLTFLCTQAAISLENARLYQQEQQKSQEIAQKEAEYRSIFESVNDGLSLVDLTTGQFVAVNPRMCQMYGYSQDKWLTLHPRNFIHTGCVDEFASFIDILNRGEEFYTQTISLHKDGHSFDVEVKAVPFIYKGKPHGLSVVRDISDRKKAENALRESEEKFRSLLSNLDGVVYRCLNDANWTMEFLSDAITNLSGYPVSDFIDGKERHYASIIHPDDICQIEKIVGQRLEQQQTFILEYRIIHQDGSIRWVTETGKGIRNNAGELSHIEGVILDINDRKRAEEATLQKSQDLEKALAQLENTQLHLVQSEKMSALGNLVAGVAHEINNPVGCIVGNVRATQDYINDLLGLIDLYAREFPDPGETIEEELEAVELDFVRDDLPKLIQAMKNGGDRIKTISHSLRTFSRADTENKQDFDIHEGLNSTVLILRHRLKANDQRPAIEVLKDYGEIPAIACFPGQLNQVFMNLLANAVDALDEASQKRSLDDLKANPNRISIRTRLKDKQVLITIFDNGPGISESVKDRIFDHLFTTKAIGKGTGLGLAIAHQIVNDIHGGELNVQSEIGQGTEFCICLPI